MIDNLRDLTDRLLIGPDWDCIMIGDGSGSGWSAPGGWCGISITKQRYDNKIVIKKPLLGGTNRGSINLMELMPYLMLLKEFRHDYGELAPPVRVHIITDSKFAVMAMGTGAGGKAHQDIFNAFKYYEDEGYVLRWYHVKRELISLNSLADKLAAIGREYMHVPLPSSRSVFDVGC